MQGQAQNSDSLSFNEGEGPDDSQEHIDVPNLGGARSDSPDFGHSGHLQRSGDPMLIHDRGHSDSPQNASDAVVRGHRGNRNPDDAVSDLKEKLKQANNTLREQQDEYKNQLLHIETISMMTKYQLVFIKMESALVKVAHIVKNKESTNINSAFAKLINHSRTASTIRKYKTQLIYYNLKDNTSRMVTALSALHKGAMQRGFKAIWFTAKAWKNDRAFKEERDKYTKAYNEALAGKENLLAQYAKKIDEMNNTVSSMKAKESDLVSKLKYKEKQLSSLEAEKADIMKAKKSPSGDTTAISIKVYEERMRDLQQENEDLKDKLSSAESNVGTFIKEMSELLDTHELSINIGSDENGSFHNHEIDEDFDSSSKMKEKGGQNQNRGKDAQAKILPQRMAYQSQQNRYPKIQHIN